MVKEYFDNNKRIKEVAFEIRENKDKRMKLVKKKRTLLITKNK